MYYALTSSIISFQWGRSQFALSPGGTDIEIFYSWVNPTGVRSGLI